MKMSKPCLFVVGVVLYLLVLLAADATMPAYLGNENCWFENIQVVVLAWGLYVCYRKYRTQASNHALWMAGMLTTILLIGRELSWGRVFLEPLPNGAFPPVAALPYGKILYPVIGIVMVIVLVLLARGHVVRYLRTYGLPRPYICWAVVAALVVILTENLHLLHWQKGILIEEISELFVYTLYAIILHKLPSR